VIYIEYISRRSDVPLAEFHRGVIAGQQGWANAHPEDRLIWSAGRTWRMGPEPEYAGVWWTPRSGFERIDEWDRIFRSGAAAGFEDPFQEVARIDAAGCYEPLRQPVPAIGGTYYAEFFEVTGAGMREVTEFFGARAEKLPGMTLNLLAHRIGKLAPEPGGLAIWTVPHFAELADIAGALDGVRQPIQLVAAGTYADIGLEIL
jgi:hypothetical protein